MINEIDEKRIVERFEGVINKRLVPISVENIRKLRRRRAPYLILKVENRFYGARIKWDMTFFSKETKIFDHMCNADCRRMYARRDEDGGCEKVLDEFTRIERYDWIKLGFETFHTKTDALVVGQCSHYEKSVSNKTYTLKEKKLARISLAQFMYEDIETYDDILRYKEKNRR